MNRASNEPGVRLCGSFSVLRRNEPCKMKTNNRLIKKNYSQNSFDTIYRNICELSPNIGPKVGDNNDITLLMYACLYNDIKLVELLINKKSINCVDKCGKNALFYLLSKPNNSTTQNLDIESANIIRLLIKNYSPQLCFLLSEGQSAGKNSLVGKSIVLNSSHGSSELAVHSFFGMQKSNAGISI